MKPGLMTGDKYESVGNEVAAIARQEEVYPAKQRSKAHSSNDSIDLNNLNVIEPGIFPVAVMTGDVVAQASQSWYWYGALLVGVGWSMSMIVLIVNV